MRDDVPSREDTTVLFCVGAQKAGTTWLYRYLADHPEVHVPPVKEMHYFDHLHDPAAQAVRENRAAAVARLEARGLLGRLRRRAPRRGADGLAQAAPAYFARALLKMHDRPDPQHRRYWRLLTHGSGDARCVADITPAYALLGPEVYAEMAAAFPRVRFLFMMRDPVARLWSAFTMQAEGRRDRPSRDPAEIAAAYLAGGEWQERARSDYGRTVATLDRAVPAERRLYLFLETLRDRGTRKLTDLLGIAPRAPGTQVVHKGRDVPLPGDLRRRLRRDLDGVYAAMRARFGDEIPAAWSAHDALAGV